jgi:DNA-binding NarL/FixJ family response regulator
MMSHTEIRVIIADDHPIFRQGLRQVLEMDSKLKIVAEADDGEAALARIEELRPDVAILDIDMPGRDGFEVARSLRDMRLPVEVIFLTMHRDEHFLNSALDAGVKGYVLKDSAVTEIVNAVKTVADAQSFISPQLSTHLINRMSRAASLADRQPGVADLSPTERRVLKMIAEYKTSKEIADQLCIGSRTVEHHRSSIATKLQLKGSHALIKFAVEHQSEL